jgi:hypothetical protein
LKSGSVGHSHIGKAMVSRAILVSQLWYVGQFIDESEDTWNKIWKMYWNYIFTCAATTKLAYKDAVKKRKHGGIGAINLKVQMQALKTHWIVRLLKDPDETWSKLFDLKLQHMAYLFDIQNVFTDKWPIGVQSQGVVGQAIYIWSTLPIQEITIKNKQTLALLTQKGKQIPIEEITVSLLYQTLMGKELTQYVVESSRNPWIDNEILWKTRWKFLRKAEFFTPKDREFKHRLWIGKLWTGTNRLSTLYPEYYAQSVNLQKMEEIIH